MTSPRAAALAASFALAIMAGGCGERPTEGARTPSARGGVERIAAAHGPDVGRARALRREPRFTWQPYSKEAFVQAKREGKLVLVDGAASWCHWCHVMDETTYLDPEIGQLVADRFVAVRFDADAAPDLAERYGAWGWPATIVLTADAREVGKFRGYIPPDELRQHLRDAVARGAMIEPPAAPRLDAGDRPARTDELPWIAASALHQLDEYWDDDEAGWGRRQKAPIGEAIEVELWRAERGDRTALERALRTIEKQRALIDPVWGGVYQYSAASNWRSPHFEKLATYQAANLSALARAARRGGRADVLADASSIRRYVDTFLTAPDGAFYTSQDADLGGHDPEATFLDGHAFYAKGDAGRRALGIPRVDTATHPYENGLLIAAYASLADALAVGTPEQREVAARAGRAASLLTKRVDVRGSVDRDGGRQVRFLSDQAAAAFGLARLAELTSDPAHAETARRIVTAMLEDFAGAPGGALYASTADPDAAGVFAERLVALPPNVLAARALAAVGRLSKEERYFVAGRAVLAGASTPRALAEQGRMIGGYVLAATELGVLK